MPSNPKPVDLRDTRGHDMDVQDLRAELERWREVGRVIEWGEEEFCSSCSSHEMNGHAPDCALDALLPDTAARAAGLGQGGSDGK